ncbi:uncharacterized protein LOC134182722 [Corticium candelabrum]|uniref:uncharacterized protein LOC134182722 n=1 Tax=Corticium candelabrum TaxID=121492 RepID=UPI002E273C87|nr:uncharacterized protein LOC134182722 [Corticium candelabrum]
MSLSLFLIVLSAMTPSSSEIVERDIKPCEESDVYKIDVSVGDDVVLKCIWSNPNYDTLKWTLGTKVIEVCDKLQQRPVCTKESPYHTDRSLHFQNIDSTFSGVYACKFYYFSKLKCSKNVSVTVAVLPASPIPSTNYPKTTTIITTTTAKNTSAELQSTKSTTTIAEKG